MYWVFCGEHCISQQFASPGEALRMYGLEALRLGPEASEPTTIRDDDGNILVTFHSFGPYNV